ncbi:MAG: HAMP domain-containing protein [Verrucomicrobia bacterium]|nr:HAMP domain-containing protein [Verrucomicrobiota bacterium]
MWLPVLPALLLAVYTNLEQRRTEKSRVQADARALAELAAANEASFVNNAHQLLATLTQFPFLVVGTNRAWCENNFANLLKLAPDYANFGLIETNGTLFCSGLRTRGGVDLSDRACFRRALATRSFAVGDFQVGRLTQPPTLDFAYPVPGPDGKPVRVLFAALKLDRLSRAAERVQLPPGGVVTVIDRSGHVLARRPDPEKWVSRSLAKAPFVRQILAQQTGTFEMPDRDEARRLYAVAAISDGTRPGMYVSVSVPLATMLAPATRLLVRNLTVMSLVGMSALILAWLFAERSIARPIHALLVAARRLAAGDTAARTGIVVRQGELAQLAGAFDEMADAMQRRQAELERAHGEIARINAELEQRIRDRTTQLEAANQELEAFCYSVSHDLRAPLRHVAGFVNLLRDSSRDRLPPEGRRYLEIIADAARQMGQLIDDLLVFSRMGRGELKREPIDLGALAQETLQSLESETAGRNIQWRLAPLPTVAGDRAMLRQVFANLLANGIKYTGPRDPAEIEVGATNGGGEVIVHVRDNGVGFDMAYADKLFGVFQRLHTDEEFEGTGIGLANVRRIISRHGGRTWAEGKVGVGAAFYFSLPHPTDHQP